MLFITLVWGATFTLTKFALHSVPVYPFVFVRFLLAALALAALSLGSRRHRRAWTRRLVVVGTVLGLFLFGGYAMQTLGLLTVSASTAGFLTGLSVVLVPIFTALWTKRRGPMRTWVGAGLAIMGLALVSGGGILKFQLGDVYVLGCAVFIALQIIGVERYGQTEDAIALATVELFVVAVCALAVAWLWPQGAHAWSWSQWARPGVVFALLINGLLGTAVAYWGQNVCQKFTTAGEIAIIFTMEPVFAAAIAWVFTGTPLSTASVVGGAFVVLSMWVADPSIRLAGRRASKA